jgi:hypothetical protein
MNKLIEEIATAFQEKLTIYKEIFKTFAGIKVRRNIINQKLNEVQRQKAADDQECNLSNKESVNNLINNFFTITDTDEEGISGTMTLTSDLFDNKIDEEFKTGYTAEDEDGNAVKISGVQERINQIFSGDDEDIEIEIPGINLLTPDRPIDSPRYTTFQGIGENVVKFIYPDLFKVENYTIDQTSGKCKLKTVTEIRNALEKYLKDKVVEYNTYLSQEKTIAASKPLTIRENQLIVKIGAAKATHTLNAGVRSYELFTYEDFIKAL